MDIFFLFSFSLFFFLFFLADPRCVIIVTERDCSFLLLQAVTSNLMDEPGAHEQWKEFERVSSSYGRHRPPKTDGDEEFDEGDEEFDRPPFVGSGSPGMTKGDYEGYDEEEDHQQKPKPKYEQFLELVKVLKQEIHSAREVLGGGIK